MLDNGGALGADPGYDPDRPPAQRGGFFHLPYKE